MSMQNSCDRILRANDNGERRDKAKVLARTTIVTLDKSVVNCSSKFEGSSLKHDRQLIKSGLSKLVSQIHSSSHNKVTRKPSKAITVHHQRELGDSFMSEDSFAEPNPSSSSFLQPRQVPFNKSTMTEELAEDDKDNIMLLSSDTRVGDDCCHDRFTNPDPRLLKKYSLVKSYQDNLALVNAGCIEEAKAESEIICLQEDRIVLPLFYKFSSISVLVLGSICGIVLIALIAWKTDGIWSFQGNSVKTELLPRRIFFNALSSTLKAVDAIIVKIFRLLTISKSELFAKEDVPWYKLF